MVHRRAPFHLEPCFPPLAFFNCHEGREHGGGGGASLANASEAELAAVLYGGETSTEPFPGPFTAQWEPCSLPWKTVVMQVRC